MLQTCSIDLASAPPKCTRLYFARTWNTSNLYFTRIWLHRTRINLHARTYRSNWVLALVMIMLLVTFFSLKVLYVKVILRGNAPPYWLKSHSIMLNVRGSSPHASKLHKPQGFYPFFIYFQTFIGFFYAQKKNIWWPIIRNPIIALPYRL